MCHGSHVYVSHGERSRKMARKVTTIPATINLYTAVPVNELRKRRVAGYARVSTDYEEQITSYEAQVDYYTNYIKSREDWEFIEIYTDEGITATNTKYRDGFNRLVEDALAGKIDLIVTKSVSRFARNTVDNLTTVRKLKEKGIEVYFEKENIWTLDSKGELLITIMSSLAQEESRSISENTTWGQRKRFADGKVSVAYSHFLGYEKGPDGCMVINKEQAETVKLLYRLYLSGLSMNAVARELTKRGLKTPFGRDIWRVSVVQSILTNEKYKGDALLQKQYTVDFLTKQIKRNEGEVPQYYVENNHEAIISPAIFDMVQNEIAKRKNEKTRYSGISIFSNKIKCGECGGWYGAKVWHSTDKYRKIVYQCNQKFSSDEKCHTPHVSEEEVKGWFVIAVNKLILEKDEIIQNVEQVKAVLCDAIKMKEDLEHLKERLTSVTKMMHEYISENARVALNQEQYEKKYHRLAEEYESLKAQCDSLAETIGKKEAKAALLDHFIKDLKEADSLLAEFDDRLWSGLVNYLTVHGKNDVRVMFKDGAEISV